MTAGRMTADISFHRRGGKWTILLDGRDITNKVKSFMVRSTAARSSSWPAEVTLEFISTHLDVDVEQAGVVIEQAHD